MTGARARRRTQRATRAYRLRTWAALRLCAWLAWHRYTPWRTGGWASRYADRQRVFAGHVYSRQCTRCGRYETKTA